MTSFNGSNFYEYVQEMWDMQPWGYLLPVWPHLAKFCHFSKFLYMFVKQLRVHLVFDQILRTPFGKIVMFLDNLFLL